MRTNMLNTMTPVIKSHTIVTSPLSAHSVSCLRVLGNGSGLWLPMAVAFSSSHAGQKIVS